MTEIRKTLEILKARWPEVMLIIGLNILSLFYSKLTLKVQGIRTSLQKMIDLVYFLALIIIIAWLVIGFLRTVYLEGRKRQSPLFLLITGKHFLWRMIGFTLIYWPVFVILVWLIFLAIKQLIPIEAGFLETAKTSPFIYQLCLTTATLIIIKPLLFIFPSIIVLDCGIFQGFKLLKRYKLLDAKELVILFLISMAVTSLWVFLPSVESATKPSQYVLIVARSITQQFIQLMIAVMAIRFVASRNLIYDNGSKPLDSQDLLNPSI
jgi:hypothetical protein